MMSRIVLLIALLGETGAGAALPEPLPMTRVIAASRDGAAPGSVLAELKRTRTAFALRCSQFGQLAAAGVADAVLDQI